ncbi:MAG: hypothetical protein JF590_07455, partial [Gemmatimonadetes bacterium]|nr:hypothetical protein [Gemmatimonadota bacterium]
MRQLAFEGNHAYTDEVLATVIATTNSTWFATFPVIRALGFGEKRHLDELDFRRDVLRLTAYYREGGFLEVQVDTVVRRTAKDAYITFRITEGRPVVTEAFAITGLEPLTERERRALVQDLPLEAGDPFDRRAMLASADTLLARLRDIARPSAQLFRNFTVDRAKRTATVEFDVVPGPAAVVGPAAISGVIQVDS